MGTIERIYKMLREAIDGQHFVTISPDEAAEIVYQIDDLPFFKEEKIDEEPRKEPNPILPGESSPFQPVEIKTLAQLLDELIIENLKIWHLVERAEHGEEGVQLKIQQHNGIRRDLVRAIDRRLEERDIGGRV